MDLSAKVVACVKAGSAIQDLAELNDTAGIPLEVLAELNQALTAAARQAQVQEEALAASSKSRSLDAAEIKGLEVAGVDGRVITERQIDGAEQDVSPGGATHLPDDVVRWVLAYPYAPRSRRGGGSPLRQSLLAWIAVSMRYRNGPWADATWAEVAKLGFFPEEVSRALRYFDRECAEFRNRQIQGELGRVQNLEIFLDPESTQRSA